MSNTSDQEESKNFKDDSKHINTNDAGVGENTFRVRLPDRTTIISETFFTPSASSISSISDAGAALTEENMNVRAARASAVAGKTFRIMRTTELDEYEDEMPIEDLVTLRFSMLRAPAPIADNFRGTARKAAKLSIADAVMEEFADLAALIDTLPSHQAMVNHNPRITTNRDSNRVEKERRNVRVRAFLYAASRENDNDFHLIIGRDPSDGEMYMNVEISGLPPSNSSFLSTLRAARNAYKTFFGDDLPGTSYDFYDPPIALEIEGSLFFDMSHATGQRPGPSSLRDDIPTVWEIHPVTRITFES